MFHQNQAKYKSPLWRIHILVSFFEFFFPFTQQENDPFLAQSKALNNTEIKKSQKVKMIQ